MRLNVPLVVVVAIFSGWMLTGLARSYALKRNMFDEPNQRSSHALATPRGGGVAIFVTFLGGLMFCWIFMEIESVVMLAFAVSGALVAIVGFVDDHKHVQARWRLVTHFLAAFWLLGLLVPGMHFMSFAMSSVALVWLVNLYNFMDGIDGIAGLEAVTVCVGAILLSIVTEMPDSVWILPAILAGAVGGFLVWNFPAAKIFMGDVGSGFIGIVIGAFAVQAGNVSSELFWAWVALLGCFIVDATITLLRRMSRKEIFYHAHRRHAYQFASRRFGSHVPVTLAVGAINVFWLLPVAFLIVMRWIDPILGLVVAWVPLVVLAITFDAGLPESVPDEPSNG